MIEKSELIPKGIKRENHIHMLTYTVLLADAAFVKRYVSY
jgi:hypothetical protein